MSRQYWAEMPPDERRWPERIEYEGEGLYSLLCRVRDDLTVRVRHVLNDPEAFENNVHQLRIFGVPEAESRRELRRLLDMLNDIHAGRVQVADTVANAYEGAVSNDGEPLWDTHTLRQRERRSRERAERTALEDRRGGVGGGRNDGSANQFRMWREILGDLPPPWGAEELVRDALRQRILGQTNAAFTTTAEAFAAVGRAAQASTMTVDELRQAMELLARGLNPDTSVTWQANRALSQADVDAIVARTELPTVLGRTQPRAIRVREEDE